MSSTPNPRCPTAAVEVFLLHSILSGNLKVTSLVNLVKPYGALYISKYKGSDALV
jgi:hypothetical protein